MSIQSIQLRLGAGKADKKRDQAIPLPAGITECRNISYSSYGDQGCLDIYFPRGTKGRLPTIVNIHGGGYVYGNTEVYRRYCMDLARRGFSVVSFNYRLAPKWKFPAPLEDTNMVLEWACQNAPIYHLDPDRLFLVGDSAGAQIASQYAAIATDPEYGALFSFTVPAVAIRALGLNCGMYDPVELASGKRKGIIRDYLGKYIPNDDPRLEVLSHITDRFPPAHITTACHDFLRHCAKPMRELLIDRGVEAHFKCYGRKGSPLIGHVFHVNIALPEATRCNDDQCAFFRSHI